MSHQTTTCVHSFRHVLTQNYAQYRTSFSSVSRGFHEGDTFATNFHELCKMFCNLCNIKISAKSNIFNLFVYLFPRFYFLFCILRKCAAAVISKHFFMRSYIFSGSPLTEISAQISHEKTWSRCVIY